MARYLTPSAPVAVLLALLYLLVSLFLVRRWSGAATCRDPTADGSAVRRRAVVALGAVLVLVLGMTLVGYRLHPGPRPVELVPFAALGDHTATEIIGNLALLMPFGALGRLVWRGGWPVLAAAGLSAAVEVFQYAAASGRVASVNDLLLNTVGAAVGWAGGVLVSRAGAADARSAGTVGRSG